MTDKLTIAHLIRVTPHRAGIYETARDLASAERALGHEARMVDPYGMAEDRGVPIGRDDFVASCDVIVNHSGLGAYEQSGKPVVHIMHGRPHSSFLLELQGKVAVYRFLVGAANDPKYSAFVTLWPEFVPYWKLIIQNRPIHVVTPPVDLSTWKADGPRGYSFHGRAGEINVVCADMWREDRDPYHVINGFWHFAKAHPGAKLHLYATNAKSPGLNVLLAALKSIHALGEVCGYIRGLDNVYRAADALITPHRIATRSVREALACGCTVVAANGNPAATITGDVESPVDYARAISVAVDGVHSKTLRSDNRSVAEANFDSMKSATELVEVIRGVLSGAPQSELVTQCIA